MKNALSEIVILAIFALLLALFINPFHIVMPHSVEYMLIAGLLLVFALFAALVWRENGGDEREQFHKLLADRVGFLAGAAVILAGLIVQGGGMGVDLWLVAALGAMVVAKLVGLIFNRLRH